MNNPMVKQYYIDLIPRIHKVLIWFEKHPEGFKQYVYNLKTEIRGNEDFSCMQRIYYLLNLLYIDKTIQHSDVRKITFDCIGIIDMVLSNWKE